MPAGKVTQERAFEALLPHARMRYEQIRELSYEPWLEPFWGDKYPNYVDYLYNEFCFDFFRLPGLRGRLYADPQKIAELRKPLLDMTRGEDDLSWLAADYVGGAAEVTFRRQRTTYDALQKAWQLRTLYDAALEGGCPLDQARTVLEWGGGYGCLAKILYKHSAREGGSPVTYILTDAPVMCAIQWLYLATIFSPEQVHIVASPAEGIRAHVFNIVPIGVLAEMPFFADLFIATWSLSESSLAAVDFVRAQQLFHARIAMLGYGVHNNSSATQTLAADFGIQEHDIPGFPIMRLACGCVQEQGA
jgi:hypothetical protein